jgi:hypothetical protein
MKKIAVFILSAMMLFAVAASSLANSVSLGYLVNGEFEFLGLGTGDAKDIILSGNFTINDKFSVFGELTDCDFESEFLERLGNYKYDARSYKLKGNYAVFQDEQVRVDLSVGYLYRELALKNSNWELEGKTLFLGPNVIFNPAENMTIIAGLEYGISPELKINDYQDDEVDMEVLNYQVDFNYYLTSQLGLSMGYRSSCWKTKDIGKITTSGITTGITYKF